MVFFKRLSFLLAMVLTLMACTNLQSNKIVSYSVYHSSEKDNYSVTSFATSTIFYGRKDVMLVDAQLTKHDAGNIVTQIEKSGKPLTLIFISHNDPDFYFGLETILQAYPNAQVVATSTTVDAMKQTAADKLKLLQTTLGKQAPSKIIMPNALANDVIYFADEIFEIRGEDLTKTYLWLPSKKLIIGGSLLFNNIHIAVSDASTSAERLLWDNEIVNMLSLQPELAMPGHYSGQQPTGIEAIDFTHQYLKTYDYILMTRDSLGDVIDSMKKLYPNLANETNLETSSKIIWNKK